ncbi:Undecaprenyl diphosphate synthase [Violaceomyces palustris]|uniref:Undecaprenyl diphosphate synthase n=1 Tax=Violaceomyces palustris TaxID=1673888 RepID=A0ACD0P825_9BASI|nr:Undecaprenyl diphosphate synthase [Violaceomyces palustris]
MTPRKSTGSSSSSPSSPSSSTASSSQGHSSSDCDYHEDAEGSQSSSVTTIASQEIAVSRDTAKSDHPILPVQPTTRRTGDQETTRKVDVGSRTPGATTESKRVPVSPLSLLSLLPLPNLQSILLSTLSIGPIPRHIAFVMDGNRRWARSSKSSIKQGHLSGFATLKKVLQVCLSLKGLDTVTVYAFAIDNFGRDAKEVDALMEIAKTRLLEMAGHGEVIARYKVRVRVIGRRQLLPQDVLEAVEKVEEMTRRNKGATLNICMPYASRDEIAGAVRERVEEKLEDFERSRRRRARDPDPRPGQDESSLRKRRGSDGSGRKERGGSIEQGEVFQREHSKAKEGCERGTEDWERDITVDELSRSMQLSHSPPLDILVRTSGVSRLSDFMLWQASNSDTHLHFVDKYWPSFGLSDMVPIILHWQRDRWMKMGRQWCGWDC